MASKDYDLFLNMMSNPQASIDTLVTSGMSINNTYLEDKDTYKNDEEVRSQFKDKYGEFDSIKFDAAYNNALVNYNLLALADYNKSMQKLATFHRDNMSVEPEKRRTGPDFIELKVANPYLITQGLITPGLAGERTKSADEIMLSNRVLLNPTTAGDDLKNAKWGDAPNDNFLGYAFTTLVLAAYSTDGEHKDLLTGEMVKHTAGLLKTDENGNFYYETLDGRDIYNKRVLNKTNILTTDGSWANSLDFFDADDIELKSVVGSTMRNLALVGSMFIPYVGPWIAGLSIATLLTGLFGTLGKMATMDSNNSVFSEMEGFAKSWSRLTATTEYALQHPWCLENMINLTGDVVGLLAELRLIFEKAPQLFTGAGRITEANLKARKAELVDKYLKLLNTKFEALKLNNLSNAELLELSLAKNAKAASLALNEMDSFIKGYNKLGEIISRGYMTAITVGDTYGEAKAAGVSDRDATLLTLGYAIGEYLLLKTGLGRWNLPETRLDKYRNLAIARTLSLLEDKEKLNLFQQAKNELSKLSFKEDKRNYVKSALTIGKNLAKNVYTAEKSNGTRTLTATAFSAAAEGVEEVSEELLADFSKGCFDVVKWMLGEDTRLNTFGYDFTKLLWNGTDIRDRYLLSLVGGAVGGGITNLATNYKMIDNYSNMTHLAAIELLIYMSRNGGLDEFMKDLNKMTLDDPNLSINMLDIDGVWVAGPVTNGMSRDAALKTAILNLVNIILGLLAANGAVSDKEFLDKLVLGDLRYAALLDSTTAGAYILEYNSLLYKIINKTDTINKIRKRSLDTNKDGVTSDSEKRNNEVSEEDLKTINKLTEEVKEHLKALEELVSGKRATEFIATSLYELTGDLNGKFSLPFYAQHKYGKKWLELTDKEKEEVSEEYSKWKVSEGRDKIRLEALLFLDFVKLFSSVAKEHTDTYLATKDEILELSKYIADASENLNIEYVQNPQTGKYEHISNEAYIENIQNALLTDTNRISNEAALLGSKLIEIFGTDEDKAKIADIIARREAALDAFNTLFDADLETITDPALKEEKLKSRLKLLEAEQQPFDIELSKLVYDTISNNIHNYILTILDRGFISKLTKDLVINLIDLINKKVVLPASLYEEEHRPIDAPMDYVGQYTLLYRQLILDKRALSKLSNTPLELNLDNFAISIGKNPIKFTELLEKANTLLYEAENLVSNFNASLILAELKEALNLLRLYAMTIKAARTDNAGFTNKFGFNVTLNEVSSKVEGSEKLNLAEIDGTTADLFLDDINTAYNRLLLLYNLHLANQGLKLSRLDRVSTKKDLLIYKRLKYIVSILDDLTGWDEDSKVKLKAVIEGAKLHDLLLSEGNTLVKEDIEFQKENLAIENAIYDFFLANSDVLENPDKLALLVNPSNFDLYSPAEELLDENLENIDDNSMIWWLASRAALKALNFYFMYGDIIDPTSQKPLAPIATLELAVYNNIANIVNGKVFRTFGLALRTSIVSDWKNTTRTEEEKKTILKRINLPEAAAKDAMTPFSLNFLPVPKYKNIVLTEGTPGSGKTSATFKITVEILRKNYKNILDKVFIAHGANPNSAKGILNDLDLPTAKTFGREELMKLVLTNWTEYPRNADNTYNVPETDYEITPENEIVRKGRDKVTSNEIPSLIIIDEISRFTAYDLDLLDAFALKHNITILVAGDFDLSGAVGRHRIPNEHAFDNTAYELGLLRTNFIRSPKLAVSMRTGNVFKSTNLVKAQRFIHDTTNPLLLEYTWNEEGLFGDLVINYDILVPRDSNGLVSGNPITDKDNLVSEIVDLVEKLSKSLKEGETINYICYDESSALATALAAKSYINVIKGGSAQGLEGRYYIVDLNYDPRGDTNIYLKDLYTGMSRALLGSIIIAPYNTSECPIITSLIREEAPVKEDISDDTIKKYAKKRKDILTSIVTTGEIPLILEPTLLPAPLGTPNTLLNNQQQNSNTPLSNNPLSNSPQSVPDSATPAQLEAERKARLEAEKLILIDNINLDSVQSLEEIDRLILNSNFPELAADPDVLLVREAKIQNILNVLALLQLLITDTLSRINSALTLDELSAVEQESLELINTNLDLLDAIETKRAEITTKNEAAIQEAALVLALMDSVDPSTITLDELNRLVDDAEHLYPGISENPNLKTFIESVKEQIRIRQTPVEPPEVQLPPVDDFDEDDAVITGVDNITDDEYRLWIERENQTKSDPQSTVSLPTSGKPKLINMLLHSMNTFETGVLEGPNGEIKLLGTPELIAKRIDSVNGLIKIDTLYEHPRRSLLEYVNMIGHLRDIIFNTPDKADLENKIQEYLGLPNIFTTFALKSSSRIGPTAVTDLDGYFGRTVHATKKSKFEKTLFNGSTDTKSDGWHEKSIVIIIGDSTNKNVLELPLLALSSPFTLILTKDSGLSDFPEVLDRFNALLKLLDPNNINLVTIALTLVSEFKNNVEYSELINLFELFLMTSGFVLYIRDPLWTPAKNLTTIGALVTSNKGYYLFMDGLSFNEETHPKEQWVSVADFALAKNPKFEGRLNTVHNPATYVTPIFISSESDFGVGHPIVHPGHAFVLVSHDSKYSNDIDVIHRYLELEENPNLPKVVNLLYVLPPKATVKLFLDLIYTLTHKKPGDPVLAPTIGYFVTPFKFLKALILSNNPLFMLFLELKLGNAASKLIETINNIPEGLSILELDVYLNDRQDWDAEGKGFGAGKQTVKYLLTGSLSRLFSIDQTITVPAIHTKDEAAMDFIEKVAKSVGIDGIFRHFPLPKNSYSRNEFFSIPYLGDRDNPYTLDGEPCLIKAKVDSHIFKGNVGWLVSDVLGSRNVSELVDMNNSAKVNASWRTPDTISYNRSGDSNIFNPSFDLRNPIEDSTIADIISTVYTKTGITIDSNIFERKSLKEAIITIANTINSLRGNNLALVIGEDLHILTNPNLLGDNKVLYSNGEVISDLSTIMASNGTMVFEVLIDNLSYLATLDTNTNTLELIEPDKMPLTMELVLLKCNINPLEIVEYIKEGRIVLEELIEGEPGEEIDPDLANVFRATSYGEFLSALEVMDGLYPDEDVPGSESMRIDSLMDMTPETDLLKKIINDLIEIERAKNAECPNPIKIKL